MKNKDEVVSIPFVAHEAAMNRMERSNKRLIGLNIFELFIILAIIVGIIVFLCLPVDEVSNTVQESNNNSGDITQNIGG